MREGERGRERKREKERERGGRERERESEREQGANKRHTFEGGCLRFRFITKGTCGRSTSGDVRASELEGLHATSVKVRRVSRCEKGLQICCRRYVYEREGEWEREGKWESGEGGERETRERSKDTKTESDQIAHTTLSYKRS